MDPASHHGALKHGMPTLFAHNLRLPTLTRRISAVRAHLSRRIWEARISTGQSSVWVFRLNVGDLPNQWGFGALQLVVLLALSITGTPQKFVRVTDTQWFSGGMLKLLEKSHPRTPCRPVYPARAC